MKGIWQQAGFTLIEVLVVVMVIAIIASFAVLAIPDRSSDRVATEAHRLAALIELSQNEAIMSSKELGLGFRRHGYEFYEQTEKGWKQIETDSVLRARDYSDDISFALRFDDIDVTLLHSSPKAPQIFILSSGEVTPFEARFKIRQHSQALTINVLGQITFSEQE